MCYSSVSFTCMWVRVNEILWPDAWKCAHTNICSSAKNQNASLLQKNSPKNVCDFVMESIIWTTECNGFHDLHMIIIQFLKLRHTNSTKCRTLTPIGLKRGTHTQTQLTQHSTLLFTPVLRCECLRCFQIGSNHLTDLLFDENQQQKNRCNFIFKCDVMWCNVTVDFSVESEISEITNELNAYKMCVSVYICVDSIYLRGNAIISWLWLNLWFANELLFMIHYAFMNLNRVNKCVFVGVKCHVSVKVCCRFFLLLLL